MTRIWLFLKSKFTLYLKKLMHKECEISIKVSLLCCSLSQGTILTPKMLFKVSQGRKFVFQAQKWAKMAIFGPCEWAKILTPQTCSKKSLTWPHLGSRGEISMKNAI